MEERTWLELLGADLDPDAVVTDGDGEGYRRDASRGVRIAQAIHHGTDHRSQICTALTTLGLEPPLIDVWAFGLQTSRVVEFRPRPRRADGSDSRAAVGADRGTNSRNAA